MPDKADSFALSLLNKLVLAIHPLFCTVPGSRSSLIAGLFLRALEHAERSIMQY